MPKITSRAFLLLALLGAVGAVTAGVPRALGQPAGDGAARRWIVGELRAVAFGGTTSPRPSRGLSELHRLGWLECDGQALDRADFQELYDTIGETWGAGEKGRFRLPDLQGFFLRGWETRRQQETYEQLMGGDIVKGREDEAPAKTRPDHADVTYFIYVGRDVNRLDPSTGRIRD